MRPQRRRTAPVRFSGVEEDSSDFDNASNDDDSSAKIKEESSSEEEEELDDDEEEEMDDEDNNLSGITQQEDSTNLEEDMPLEGDDTGDDGEGTSKSNPRRPRKPRLAKPRKEKPVCPHCDKVFSVPSRLVYHLENFVCRPELRKEEESAVENDEISEDDDSGVKVDEHGNPSCMFCQLLFENLKDAQEHVRGYVCRERQKQESDEEFLTGEGDGRASNGKAKAKRKGKKGKKKIKSEDNDEVMSCPLCKRVFTSAGGLEYHQKNKVCLNTKKRKIAFATIPPGECFDTKYGVVRVIKDDRASSNIQLPANIMNLAKKYSSSKVKREIQIQKHCSNVATASLARRQLLCRLYEKNTCTQASVFEAYYGLDPRQLKSFKKAAPYPRQLKNPSVPAQANPDRIVECVLVPDERPRYIGLDTPEPLEGLANESATRKPTKLFLQRSLLTKTYSRSACRIFCSSCMQCFISRSGFTHHESNGNCMAKIEAAKEKKAERQKNIEVRAAQIILRHDTPNRRAVAKGAKPKIVNTGTGKALKEKIIKRESKDIVSPLDVIAQLKAELHMYQGSMIGPVYPAVWKALGYKKPSQKKKKKKRKRNKKKRKRIAPAPAPAPAPEKKIKTSAEDNTASVLGLAEEWGTEAASWMMPPPELLPVVPVVDTRVIVAEVVSGRYPTMKRYDGEHETSCTICKRQELSTKKSRQALIQKHNLLECGFCKRVVHFQCMLNKFIVKDPEPEDEFICHSCIQTVTHRRKRAEKRRLEKLDMEPQREDELLAKRRKVATLVSGDIHGQEYESISAQLQRIDEISVLLNDSKARLLSSMKTAQINESARALISDFEESHSSQFHAST